MAKDTQNTMPQSMAGLQRFNSADNSKFKIRPEHVIILLILVVLIVLFMHWQGNSIIGL